ncbi:MAG: 3'-5' exonuclease [Deltaproteobacteria bacterium]|nr:3'-5' exonuclease [Deltaproteobacteria bacterium]
MTDSVIVFDTETTGLSPRYGHRIIEIGAVKLSGETIVDEFHSLIDAGVVISPQAQAVHGISRAMLRGQPRPEEVFFDFHNFIGQSLLVAHNAPFDLRFLRAEFGLLGFGLANQVECTLKLSRKYLSDLSNYRLETVYRHLGGVVDDSVQRHRALDDARMAAFVWLGLQ